MGFQILERHHSVNSQRLVRTPCNKVHLHTLFMILIIVFCLSAMLPLPLQSLTGLDDAVNDAYMSSLLGGCVLSVMCLEVAIISCE